MRKLLKNEMVSLNPLIEPANNFNITKLEPTFKLYFKAIQATEEIDIPKTKFGPGLNGVIGQARIAIRHILLILSLLFRDFRWKRLLFESARPRTGRAGSIGGFAGLRTGGNRPNNRL